MPAWLKGKNYGFEIVFAELDATTLSGLCKREFSIQKSGETKL